MFTDKVLSLRLSLNLRIMETANWLISEILGIVGSLAWNFFTKGFLFSLLGFFLGAGLVYLGHRRGGFRRPNKVWNIAAKLHYIYIPLLAAILFGTFASIYSIQNTTNGWIDDSSTALQSYALDYLPEVQNIAAELGTRASVSEDALGDIILEKAGLEDNRMAGDLYQYINRKIIGLVLSTLGYEDDVANVAKLAEPGGLDRITASSFSGLSTYLKQGFVSSYMSGIYWWMILLFLPFIGFAAGEYVFYRINRVVAARIRKRINKGREE